MKKWYIIASIFAVLGVIGTLVDNSTQASGGTMSLITANLTDEAQDRINAQREADRQQRAARAAERAAQREQEARSAWRIISGESLASGRWQEAYSTNGNQQIRFDYIPSNRRPANAEDFYSFDIYLWNGDSFICGYGVDNTISVYYRIDNGATGRVSSIVRDNREYVRLTIEASGPHTRTIPNWRGREYSAFDVDSFVRDLRRGRTLTIQTIDSCGTNTTFSFDLTGFSRVIDQEING